VLGKMPTVEINILWDGAACFQIARIFIYFAALYKWNIQCAATSMYAMIILQRCVLSANFISL
jgi:hypothetical protein